MVILRLLPKSGISNEDFYGMSGSLAHVDRRSVKVIEMIINGERVHLELGGKGKEIVKKFLQEK